MNKKVVKNSIYVSLIFVLLATMCFSFSGCSLTKYQINLTSNNNQWGNVYGSGEYASGTDVLIVAIAIDGYDFSNWSDGSVSPIRHIKADKDLNLQASFVKTQQNAYALDKVEFYAVKTDDSKVKRLTVDKLSIYKRDSSLKKIFDVDMLGDNSANAGGAVLISSVKNGTEEETSIHATNSKPLVFYSARNETNVFEKGVEYDVRYTVDAFVSGLVMDFDYANNITTTYKSDEYTQNNHMYSTVENAKITVNDNTLEQTVDFFSEAWWDCGVIIKAKLYFVKI